MTKQPQCIDCIKDGVTTIRPIDPFSGPRSPRCSTHVRSRRKQAQVAAHARRMETGYGITAEQYWELYAAQGGKCAICQTATGKVRRLAVDHDHKICQDHPPDKGCPNCIRGLLCKRCNQLVAWFTPEALGRAIAYLFNPPARSILRKIMWIDD